MAQWLRCWTVVQEVQGSIPALGKKKLSLFQVVTEEVMKDHRPNGHGPSFDTGQ